MLHPNDSCLNNLDIKIGNAIIMSYKVRHCYLCPANQLTFDVLSGNYIIRGIFGKAFSDKLKMHKYYSPLIKNFAPHYGQTCASDIVANTFINDYYLKRSMNAKYVRERLK